ncbi:hypothetical protein [Modestobacter sp. Leaf380]|uniref:hypothetical protein n=1 Tax=Modestobacter sp. Leaf380 TaxID=1736356 RepID=UPI0006F4EC9D|nr:hypothetical protein [Modestobacter sp. Leaf380]KQS68855.1 hypothetical protein ASG41_08090 [Modestobacter sp. Leaf380]
MVRWLCALVAAFVVSGFAYLLVTGRYANDGPVLLQLTVTHGLHAGDLFIVAGWVVAMAALALLLRTPHPVRG